MQTPTHLHNLLSHLEGVRPGRTGYTAKCPAHDDLIPSLSIKMNNEGVILIHCFAGCTPEAVLSACGLTFSDLYDDRPRHHIHAAGPVRNAAYGDDLSTSSRPFSARISLQQFYVYESQGGTPLFRVCRYDSSNGTKSFQLQRYDGQGGWVSRLEGVGRVLYRLPEVMNAIREGRRVHVVEGEKNADDLMRRGLIATTNPQGAGRWNTYGNGYTETLRGADVVLLYDNDMPGRRHRDEVARSLNGVARSVRVVDLPGLGEHQDISDWLERGGTIEQLERLASLVPEWSPEMETLWRADVIRAADVKPESVEWLWPGYVARGRIVTAEGDPGLAISTVILDLAARISTGGALPDGQELAVAANVVLLSVEDGLADTTVPRLKVAGADLTRIHVLRSVRDEHGARTPLIPDDIPILKALILKTRAALVVIDPLMACLSPAISSHHDQGMAQAVMALRRLAEETGAAIAVVRHCGRGGIGGVHGGGSIGSIGMSGHGLLFAADPDTAPDSGRMVVAVTRSGPGPVPPALLYRIQADADLGCGHIIWEGTTAHTADDLAGHHLHAGGRSALAQARDFLASMIGETPVAAQDLMRAAEKAGISFSTLNRAKRSLGVSSIRAGKERRWLWGFGAASAGGQLSK